MNVKMKFFIVICAFLQVSHQNPISHWTLLPHILVVEVDGGLGQQPLSCLESPEVELTKTEDIFWMKNGVQEAQRGNSYLVLLDESLGGGNYTCHSKDGAPLNHTVVLIQEYENQTRKILVKTDQEDYLKCSAQNYNGEFNCSWTWHSSRPGSKVAFIKARRVSDDNYDSDTECSVDSSGRRYTCSSGQSRFSCLVNDGGNGISCADERHCPYAEEKQPIHVSIYFKTTRFLVENYFKHFYLSEIVKPDKLEIIKVNTTTIKWSYPSSWSSPFSYFPLTFEIAQLRGRCKRCNNPCTDSKATKTVTVHSTDVFSQFEVKPRAKAVCVRAKDELCNSLWSEWSHLRLRGHKKNKKNKRPQNKKQA